MYEVAFDIKYEGFWSLFFVAPGFLFCFISYYALTNREKISRLSFYASGKKSDPKKTSVVLWFMLIFATFWTGLVSYGLGSQLFELLSKYHKGDYLVIEGIVENFDPMPYSGRKRESFSVKGIYFQYSDFSVTPGFNNTTSHGGPIREGLQVRISYIGNTILKLETLKTK
ncbi:hypothetical protein [Vibrio nigripulchritudo]|uniref:hypothetical protein n=1 Tax=Vibrio nigripulchritudo TaxID=28173 RepID=UPI0003B19EC9|nr:hypothetical protein [Vibrio nigripulchritudo]CCN69674.1 putative Membrane protein [Vibrio nigripulchritudo SFn118]